MPLSRNVVVQFHRQIRLPFLRPDARIALTYVGTTANPRTSLIRRRPRVVTMHGRCRRRGNRIRACLVHDRVPSRRANRPVITCRLSVFVFGPDVVNQLARRVRLSELRAFRRALEQHSRRPILGRDLRLYVLLRLQRSRTLTAADRRHPSLTSAWNAFVRSEHRRMLKRLRHAVRRLERAQAR